MQYTIKLFSSRGGIFPSTVPFADLARARAAFDQQQVGGRFTRAELWRGHTGEAGWVDEELIDTKLA